jgi:hypothetical protein
MKRLCTFAFRAALVSLGPFHGQSSIRKRARRLISSRPASPLVSPTPAVEQGERVQLVALTKIVSLAVPAADCFPGREPG